MSAGEWEFDFDAGKSEWLKRNRKISFEEIVVLVEGGGLVQVLARPDEEKYPEQILLDVDVDGYICVVPTVRQGSSLFLKTVNASRKATKRRKMR